MKWHKQHKWFGIAVIFFLLMFCLSGIVLNHRSLFSDVEVGRSWLPSSYEYKQWNGGLLRGTVRQGNNVLIYGNNGIWLTDTLGRTLADFNLGLPHAADHRQVRNIIKARGRLFAATTEAVYRYDGGHIGWKALLLPKDGDERLTDITSKGDTVIVVGRSFLYLSTTNNKPFVKSELPAPVGYDGKVSLFRTVWMLHSGELFGTVGRLIVDAVAVVLIVLCLTGLVYWLLPKYIKRKKRKGNNTRKPAKLLRLALMWHNKVGRATIILTLLVTVTGWCLRPPVLIPLALNSTKALPFTTLDSPNPWNDRLRMLRYDAAKGDWLLSASDGIYSIKSFNRPPVKLQHTPPVSVMGLNVLQKDASGRWLCGSFSGLFVWNRHTGSTYDYFTRQPAPEKASAPFGQKAISGFSSDFAKAPFAVDYYDGTSSISQPDSLRLLPMSLWNAALEVHSGRIYIGTLATLFFVFIVGAACAWCLWSGWKLRSRKTKRSM